MICGNTLNERLVHGVMYTGINVLIVYFRLSLVIHISKPIVGRWIQILNGLCFMMMMLWFIRRKLSTFSKGARLAYNILFGIMIYLTTCMTVQCLLLCCSEKVTLKFRLQVWIALVFSVNTLVHIGGESIMLHLTNGKLAIGFPNFVPDPAMECQSKQH